MRVGMLFLPHPRSEIRVAPMSRMPVGMISLQMVRRSVHSVLRVQNTPYIASYSSPIVLRFLHILIYIIKSSYHILHLAFSVWHHDRNHSRPIISDAHLHAAFIGKPIQVRVLTVCHLLEISVLQPRSRSIKPVSGARCQSRGYSQRKSCSDKSSQCHSYFCILHYLLFLLYCKYIKQNLFRNIKNVAIFAPRKNSD